VETVSLWSVFPEGRAKDVGLGEVVTHPQHTTANAILHGWSHSQTNGVLNVDGMPFGQEFSALQNGKTVVTSDFLRAIKCAYDISGSVTTLKPPSCLGKFRPFDVDLPFLFTGLVVHDDTMKKPKYRGLIRNAFQVLQAILDEFHTDGDQMIEAAADTLASLSDVLTIGPKCADPWKCDPRTLGHLCVVAVRDLKDLRVFPRHLSVDPVAWAERLKYHTQV
jgi:hypothetical protein